MSMYSTFVPFAIFVQSKEKRITAETMSTPPLRNKVALVTGASSGIGRAIALALANEGARLVCCDLSEHPNPTGYEADIDKSTSELITKQNGEAFFQKVDISVSTQIEAAVNKAIEVRGRTAHASSTDHYCAC